MRSASLVVLLALLSLDALAAPTRLTLRPDDPGEPWVAAYSQAVNLRARLVSADGTPIAGERVSFRLQRGDDEATLFLVDDPVTDAEGYATGRLTLVDGRHGGQTFPARAATAEVPGERYRVRARFLGAPFAEGCDELDAGPPDDGGPPGDEDLCTAEDELDLFVGLETSTLVIAPGIEVALGGVVQLIATLTDENGDAPIAGTAIDGDSPVPIAGRQVGFFYDRDGSGSPQQNERIFCDDTGLGHAVTNAQGRAACDFLADPAFVTTSTVQNGIHAQFGGDDRYSLAGAAQAIRIGAGLPDAERTLLDVDPEEANADGFSIIEVRARLVDVANNLLGIDDPAYDVAFISDLGTFEGEPERDPITGHYRQRLRAPHTGGDATVQVVVEDVPGTTAAVRFVGGGCDCGASGGGAPLAGLAALLAGLAIAARRRTS